MTRERILVIEDEADLREVLAYNLKREGFQVDTARDGGEGLRMARERQPDLVLLDLMLPDLDGLEVCRRLRQDEELSDMPIIMVTAKGEETDIVVGLLARSPFGGRVPWGRRWLRAVGRPDCWSGIHVDRRAEADQSRGAWPSPRCQPWRR